MSKVTLRTSFSPYRQLYETLHELIKWIYTSGKGPLPEGLNRAILTAQAAARESEALPKYQYLVDSARRLYERDDEIEIDDEPVISLAEDGAFVGAWLWVPFDEESPERRMTEDQQIVYSLIQGRANPATMDSVDFDDVHRLVGRVQGWKAAHTKIVLESLVLAGWLVAEVDDRNFEDRVFYWTPQQYRRLDED